MLNFWEWLNEAVEQQKERLLKLLQIKFPRFKPQQLQQLFVVLSDLEKLIKNQEDIRKSQTIYQFLKNYKDNNDSFAHTIDRFKIELTNLINKNNNKGKSAEDIIETTRQILIRRLPGESKEVIESLLQQIRQGARTDDVINKFLANKKSAIGDKIVAKEGSLEMIAISDWREDGTKEKHIDEKKGLQFCHPLLKGTKWCTRFQEYFDHYTNDGPLYLVRSNGKPLILGHKNSDWLDTNDEFPDIQLMEKLSVFILKANIDDVSPKVIYYLPKPVEMTEEYLKNKDSKIVNRIRSKLVGFPYLSFENGTLEIAYYNGISDALGGLRSIGNNKIDFDFHDVEENITTFSWDQLNQIKDLIDNLNDKNENILIDLLNKNYKNDEYGEIENWDDLDLNQSIEYDDKLVSILNQAADDTVQEETIKRVINIISKELESGDDNGFWIDTKTWKFQIESEKVNTWIKEEIEKSNSYDIQYIGDNMNFQIEVPELELEFSYKVYNEKVLELLKENNLL